MNPYQYFAQVENELTHIAESEETQSEFATRTSCVRPNPRVEISSISVDISQESGLIFGISSDII